MATDTLLPQEVPSLSDAPAVSGTLLSTLPAASLLWAQAPSVASLPPGLCKLTLRAFPSISSGARGVEHSAG